MEINPELRSKETWLISEDGLWDICFGLSLLGFALSITLSHAIWFIGFVMLGYFFVLMAGKETITRPRMFNWLVDDQQLIKLDRWIKFGITIILLGLVAGAITFWLLDPNPGFGWLPEYGIKLLCVSIAVFLFMFGYLTRNGSRYYVYAGISILILVIFEIFSISNLVFVYFSAAMLILSGFGNLIRFLTIYPKQNTQGNITL